jgi:FkbH-like protein
MRLNEAMTTVRRATLHETSKLALVCSFEPLHLKTYLQAHAIERLGDAQAPEIVTFGFDALRDGLRQTSGALKTQTALLFLNWNDFHPALSWRTRGELGPVAADELGEAGATLLALLSPWLDARADAETYVILPPDAWFPLLDAVGPDAIGSTRIAADRVWQQVADVVTEGGGRLLDLAPQELNFRDWLSSGCPLTVDDSDTVAASIMAAIHRQPRRKCLVVDLDDTLWHGIIGEVGAEGIHCGDHGRGYPFFVFQKFIAKLRREGVLIAFCSKNNWSDVEPVFGGRGLPLGVEDFAAWRCNWEPKSANITAIARELNIGLDAIVYVDDSRAEIAEVTAACPGVTAIVTPDSGAGWLVLFQELQRLFFTWSVSGEDRLRHATFAANRARSEAQAPPAEGSLAHLRDFGLKVTVNADAFGEPRSLELINKTNQFNLTGERISTADWLDWRGAEGAFCLSARLEDRYGDYGTIAVVTGRRGDGDTAELRQAVLSCRAFNRGVERVLLHSVCEILRVDRVAGPFLETGKNAAALKTLQELGCRWDGGRWELDRQAIEHWYEKTAGETAVSVVVAAN